VRSACASFLGCPHESSRSLRWRFLCTSRLGHPCQYTTPAGVQVTLAGDSRPFWKGIWVGFSRHMGAGVLATAQIADRRCPATVGRCFGDGRKAVGRRLADSASQAEFNVRPQIASVTGPVGAWKAAGRRPVCRLAREMPAFTPASEQRLTPTVRRAGSFAVKDASWLKRGRSTAGAEFNTVLKTASHRKLRGRLNCPSRVRRRVALQPPEGYRRRTEGDRKVDGRFRLQSRTQSSPAVYLRRRHARPPEGGWKVVGL
jgi:hypothetical protein